MSETLTQQVARYVSSYFRLDSPRPYEVDTTDGTVIYMRWSSDDVNAVFIARIRVSGALIYNDYGIDLWANRTTATYSYNVE